MVESSAASEKYVVPFTYRKHFSPEQCTELVNSFKNYDKDNNGVMDKAEFKQALKDMGHDEVTDQIADNLLKRVDKDNSGVIEWVEFLDMMQMVKVKGKKSGVDFITAQVKGVGSGKA